MSKELVIRRLLLPELRFCNSWVDARPYTTHIQVEKESETEVCPRCATASRSTYDRRTVTVRDAPIRQGVSVLHIRKRRFWCKPCARPFTEPVPGVRKGHRTTERYGRHLLDACERYSDLKHVRKDFRCSSSFLYRTLYRHLELKRRQRQYPFPKIIGIDEHFFKKDRKYGGHDFVTMVVDYTNKRVMALVHGKTPSSSRTSSTCCVCSVLPS